MRKGNIHLSRFVSLIQALLVFELGVGSASLSIAATTATRRALPPRNPAPTAQLPHSTSSPRIGIVPPEDARTLAGHQFLRNGITAFPLVAPYINSSLETALTTLNIPGADAELKTVGLSPSVTGQMKFGHVGVEIGAQLSELFGADSYSAYVLGATLDYAFSGSLRYEAIRERRFALTPALSYSHDNGLGFSPLSAADAAITSPAEAKASNLLLKTSLQQIRPSLLGAYAFSSIIGVSGELGVSFDRTKTGDESENIRRLRIGIASDANFTQLHVPVGASVFFRDDISLGSSQSPSPIIGGGVYEMFHRNFNFGIEFARLLTSTPTLSILLSLTAYY